jgi:LmbE family N-acetylglucosaminyl deacetylase
MIQLKLNPARPLEVVCFGAHSDDIEIGCGGTILRFREEYPCCRLHWVVFSAIGEREGEALKAAGIFGGSNLAGPPMLKDFRDGFLPYTAAEVKQNFEEVKRMISPDLIFTPSRNDAHQDHRFIGELAWNTFRDHLILEYEIPKYDGDMGRPSLFVPLAPKQYFNKVNSLMEAFPSQHAKRWFQPETFLSLMRLRGMECNAPSGYAEAFYCRKMVF